MTVDEVIAKFLGKSAEPEVFEVEKGASKRYAVAADDLNPLYLDEEAAMNSKYGTIIAPPGFYGWPVRQPAPRLPKIMEDLVAALVEAEYPATLDAGIEFDFVKPAREGDILLCTRTLTEISRREGAGGKKSVQWALETTYVNQHGQVVSRTRQRLISRFMSAAKPS